MLPTSLRTFYGLAAAQLLSLIGSRISGVAIALWLYAGTGQTSPLLMAAFCAELPTMLLGSVTGILADRWDKRYVIMLGDAGQALGTLLLMTSLAAGRFALWHLYVVMALQGLFVAVQRPASESAITVLVPDSQRDRANGLMQMGFPLASVVAPVFAGLLYRAVGLAGVLIVDLLTFAAAVLVVWRLPIPRLRTKDGPVSFGTNWHAVWAGWRWLMQQRGLLGLVVLIAMVNFLINGPLEMAIPYLIALAQDERIVGMLLGAMSGGALAGASAIAIIGQVRARVRTILLSYTALGAMFIAFGSARQPFSLGVISFMLMFPLPLVGAVFNSLIQDKAPPSLQGRVFAAAGQAFVLATPFSFLLTGWLVDHLLEPWVSAPSWRNLAPLLGATRGAGMSLLLCLVGVLILGVTGLAGLWPPLRKIERALPDQL